MVIVACLSLTACSEGELPARQTSQDDVGTMAPEGPGSPGDRPDGGESPGQTGPARPNISTFTGCGASGVSSDEGVRAVQCYGPWDVSGREIQDQGVRWQPGGFRVMTPR